MIVQNKHVLVVGLARSGWAVADALARRGAVVTVTDRKPPSEFSEFVPHLVKQKMGLELGSQRVETFLRQNLIVISPGVPWDLPQLQAARGRKIPIYPEVEAAAWFLKGTLVGVTGSNGKTTTTSLLGAMLQASGFPTFVGGNIGRALSTAVDQAPPGTRFVTELSSFQLEGIQEFHPHVAVMLNLSPNHLDRHPSLEAYAQAKRRIFLNQLAGDYAVLNADDAWVAGLGAQVHSRAVFFSRERELPNGVFVAGGKVLYRVRHLERVLFETRDVRLRGDFNLEDVLAATTAACVLGADFTAIRKAVRDFKAVEHRLEFVAEIRGVDFYNNSKATSVDATVKSLGAFERGVHLIMGGKDKGAPYAPLLPLVKERVREILLIGAAAPVIAEQLAGATELVRAGDLANAVRMAFSRARPGETVLLAPACSSFDQFKDYEERGRVFKELVKTLRREVAADAPPGPARRAADSGAAARDPERKSRDARAGVRNTSPAPLESEAGKVRTKPPTEVTRPGERATIPDVEAGATQAQAPQSAAAKPEPPAAARQEPSRDPGGRGPEPQVPAPEIDLPKPQARKLDLEIVVASPPIPISGVEARPPAPESVAPTNTLPSLRIEFDDVEPEPSRVGGVPKTPPASPPVIDWVVGAELDSAAEMAGTTRSPGQDRPHAPRHIELRYVFEVSAVEMPAAESQAVPDDEPVILISTGPAESLEDEALPYEVRPANGKSTPQGSQPAPGAGKSPPPEPEPPEAQNPESRASE